jgi:hypothetical protein
MQIGIGGAAGNSFGPRGVDFDGDGKTGAHDPADAIATAAVILIKDKGAPVGKPIDAYRTAVRAYNGSGPQAEAYADRVLADARTYAGGANAVGRAGCGEDVALDPGGSAGKVTIAPGANRAGVPIQPILLRYVAGMAGLADRPIVITTGTNHNQYTVGGNVSDHWDGHAADLGMAANGGTDDGPVGDRIMIACLVLAGEPQQRAATHARAGGLFTLDHAGLRIQCIWKTNHGGNHHNHVHVGVRPKPELDKRRRPKRIPHTVSLPAKSSAGVTDTARRRPTVVHSDRVCSWALAYGRGLETVAPPPRETRGWSGHA